MNTKELVSYLRTNILDDTGGEGADWENFSENDFDSIQLRWTNEELINNINEAITLVYRRTHPIKTIGTLSLIATPTPINSYTLPVECLEVLLVKLSNGKPLDKTDIDALWNDETLFTEINIPRVYVVDMEQNTITFYPTPVENDTVTYMYFRLPSTPLSWSAPLAYPELRIEFHLPMLFYAAHLCYMKDEANTMDPKRAMTYLALFDAEFPPVSSYGAMRKSHTANRPINYGGIRQPNYGSRIRLQNN
jgi:hypothetical protein